MVKKRRERERREKERKKREEKREERKREEWEREKEWPHGSKSLERELFQPQIQQEYYLKMGKHLSIYFKFDRILISKKIPLPNEKKTTIQYGQREEKKERKRERMTTWVKECMREPYQPKIHRVYFKKGSTFFHLFQIWSHINFKIDTMTKWKI